MRIRRDLALLRPRTRPLKGKGTRLETGDLAFKYDPTRHLDEHGFRPSGITFARPGSGKNRISGVTGISVWSSLGPPGGDVADAAVSTVDPNIVLAGIAPDGSVGGTLYRSSDGGNTWSEVPALSWYQRLRHRVCSRRQCVYRHH